MDSSISLSNSVSKETNYENTELSGAYFEDLKSRNSDSISNERIRNGDLILDTYLVTSDEIPGGMGSVWRVRHNSWNTDLAMKRPQPQFFAEGGETKKKRFVEECENWINLGLHPNIVSCYYVREIGGVPTIFSEWMDGGSMSDCIKDGSLYEGSEDEIQARILDIAIQSARGLQYSHENGLLHQDMKPGNLLLTADWAAKVADFGLSKAKSQLGDNPESTQTSGYTPAYCPAEQAGGDAPERWMDVYAWALTVLEMYAGERLWSTGAGAKENYETVVSRCRCGIPGKLIPVLRSCLTDRPDGFTGIEDTLVRIYRERTGSAYARLAAKASDTADSLNNRALSYIDLGMPDTAEALWKKALSDNPLHLNTVYNLGLFEWHDGRIDDVDLRERLESVSHQQMDHAADAGPLLERIDLLKDDLCYRVPDCSWSGSYHPAALCSGGNILYMPSFTDIFNDYRGHEPIDKRDTKTGERIWRSVSSNKFQKSHGVKLDSGLRMMAVSMDGAYLALIGENGIIEIWDTGQPVLIAEKKLFSKFELMKLRARGTNFYATSFEERSYAEFSEDNTRLSGRLYGRTFIWEFKSGGVFYASDSSGVFYNPVQYCQDIASGRVYSPDGSKYLGLTEKNNACVFTAKSLPLQKLKWELSVIESFSAARARETQAQKLLRLGREALEKRDISGALGYIEQLRGIKDISTTQEFLDLNRSVGEYCEIAGVNKIQIMKDQVYSGPDIQKILTGINVRGRTAFDISGDGTLAVVGEGSGDVSVWDTESGNLLWRRKAHDHEVCCVAISEDGTIAASAEYGGAGTDYRTEKIVLYDARSGRETDRISYEEIYYHCYNEEWNPFAPNQHITALVFNRRLTKLAFGSSQGSVAVVHLAKNGEDRYEAAFSCSGSKMENRILGLAFGADDRHIWSLDMDYSDPDDPVMLRLWKSRFNTIPVIAVKLEETDYMWSDGCVIKTCRQDTELHLYGRSDRHGERVSYTVLADYQYRPAP